MDVGIEIIAESDNLDKDGKKKRKTMYLVFKSTQERNVVFDILLSSVRKDCVTTETSLV